jgi:hypothetical protein
MRKKCSGIGQRNETGGLGWGEKPVKTVSRAAAGKAPN